MDASRQTILEHFVVAAKHAALDREYARAGPRTVTCIICESQFRSSDLKTTTSACRFGGGKLDRHYCPRCGALFGPLKMLDMTPAELATEYAILYASYSEGDTSADAIHTFLSLSPDKGPVYLDWGCGWWSPSIAKLRNEGWNAWGYEPTPGGTDPFIVTNIGHIAPGLAGIYSNNTIEHFTNPIEEFRSMRRLLVDGGKMAHSTPCYTESYMDTRFHTLFLLEDSVHVLAEKTGFKVLHREENGDYMNVVFQAI